MLGQTLNFLKEKEKQFKKRGLRNVQTFLKEGKEEICSELIQSLLTLFQDESETIREKSVEIISKILPQNQDESSVLKAISNSLGVGEGRWREPVEEIRLLLCQLAFAECKRIKLDDPELISPIVSEFLADRFPEIIKESCRLLIHLCSLEQLSFSAEQSELLCSKLAPLLRHAHSSIRLLAIKAICNLALKTAESDFPNWFENVLEAFDVLLDDRNPAVQQSAIETAMQWIKLPAAKNSIRVQLLKIIFGGLGQESEEFSLRVKSFLQNIHLRNDEQTLLYGSPAEEIIDLMTSEVSDWKDSKRFRAVRLLTNILEIGELEIIVSFSEKLLTTLQGAIQDDMIEVRKQIQTCAIRLGEKFEFKIWHNWICANLNDEKLTTPEYHVRTLMLLRALLEGQSATEFSSEKMETLEDLLVQIRDFRRFDDTEQILISTSACLLVTLEKFSKEDLTESSIEYILETLLHLETTSSRRNWENLDFDSIHESVANAAQNSVRDVYISFFKPLFNYFTSKDQWSMCLFCTFLIRCSCCVGCFSELVVPLLGAKIQQENIETKQTVMSAICTILEHTNADDFDVKQVEVLLLKICVPLCKWKVGKIAAKVRSSAMKAVFSLFQHNFVCDDLLKRGFSSYFPSLVSNSDDDWDETIRRHCILSIISILKRIKFVEEMNVDLSKLPQKLIARLDDAQDDIRMSALLALEELIPTCLSSDKKILLKCVEAALIHLDDTNTEIQERCFSFLSKCIFLAPREIESKLDEFEGIHSKVEHCKELKKLILQIKE